MALSIALLGIGKMGRNHLRILSMLKDVEVKWIYDLNETELEKVAKDYGVNYTTDIITAVKDVDAVVIVTPTSTHYDYFKICSEYVNSIFIEKPLAETLEQAIDIKAICTEKDIFVQCGFIERFNPVVSGLKSYISDSSVINADFTRTNRLSVRISDVDVVLDLMIHDIDLALYINGPVKSVVAFGQKENELVAFASALLCHENGSLSRILASRMTEKKVRAIHVTTTNAYIDAELLRKELIIHKQSSISQAYDQPYIVSSLEQQLEVKPQEALLVELQAFIKGCHGQIDSQIPDVHAGVESLRVAELILEQIENGQR